MKHKITLISDTHNKHNELILPGGDILIHAGDATVDGTKQEALDFLDWFRNQPYQHKLVAIVRAGW